MFGIRKHVPNLPDEHYESLDGKVKAYRQIFDEKGFTYEKCPNTRYCLDELMTRSLQGTLPKDMSLYFANLRKSAVKEGMVEEIGVLNPRKIRDAAYDDSILLDLKDLILDVSQEVLMKKGGELTDFWLKVSERKAIKGHRWADLNQAIFRAESYANYCGNTIPDATKEHLLSLQGKGIKEYGRRNTDVFKNYLSRQFSRGISKKRFKHLLKIGEEIATEMKTSLWKDDVWSSTTELLLREDKQIMELFDKDDNKKRDDKKA
jgi:hypothetical protein